MRNNISFINVYSKKNLKSKVVTQLLYGETFKIINKNKKWIKIKNDLDGYRGFVKLRKFSKNQKNTHKVCTLSCNLYSKPNLNYKIRDHSLAKIPLLLICGKKEVDSNSVTIRRLDSNKQENMDIDQFLKTFSALNKASSN